MLAFDSFYFLCFDLLIQQWCRFYNNIVARDAISREIITSQFFYKIVDVENDLVSDREQEVIDVNIVNDDKFEIRRDIVCSK